GLTGVRQSVDDRVDLVLGADVDAAGRLVEDEQVGLGVQPLAQDDLLLVAAGELADDGHHGRRLDVQVLPVLLRDGDLLVAVHPAAAGELLQAGGADVPADVLDEVEAVLLPVLGGVGDAGLDGLGHGPGSDLLAVEVGPPGDVATVGLTEAGRREVGACRGPEAGAAADLPGAHVQAGAVDAHPSRLGRVHDGPVLDAEDLLPRLRGVLGEEVVDVPADHAADDAGGGRVGRGHVDL